jgi:hypothetical protein
VARRPRVAHAATGEEIGLAHAGSDHWTCDVVIAAMDDSTRSTLEQKLKMAPIADAGNAVAAALVSNKVEVRAIGVVAAQSGWKSILKGRLSMDIVGVIGSAFKNDPPGRNSRVEDNGSALSVQAELIEFDGKKMTLDNGTPPEFVNEFANGEAKVFRFPGDPRLVAIIRARFDLRVSQSK